jgi:hypothetical protein
MLALATKVVGDYGKVLARVAPDVYGLPESLLPHSKPAIREAIVSLLEQLGSDQVEIKEGLRRGYVYLAQFVSDVEAEIVSRGQAHINGMGGGDASSAEPAMRIINRIKLDMERALEEMGAYP